MEIFSQIKESRDMFNLVWESSSEFFPEIYATFSSVLVVVRRSSLDSIFGKHSEIKVTGINRVVSPTPHPFPTLFLFFCSSLSFS